MTGPARQDVQRKLAAIFAADVEGYSRLMSLNEVGTLRALTAHREVMDSLTLTLGATMITTNGEAANGGDGETSTEVNFVGEGQGVSETSIEVRFVREGQGMGMLGETAVWIGDPGAGVATQRG